MCYKLLITNVLCNCDDLPSHASAICNRSFPLDNSVLLILSHKANNLYKLSSQKGVIHTVNSVMHIIFNTCGNVKIIMTLCGMHQKWVAITLKLDNVCVYKKINSSS